MSLYIRRNEGETWRECVERIATKCGLVYECLDNYDDAVKAGADEADAAFEALYEWDCCSKPDNSPATAISLPEGTTE